MRFLAFISCWFVLGLGATAQTVDANRLDELATQTEAEKAKQAELERSRNAVRSEIRTLRSDLVKVGKEASALEAAGRAIEARMAELEIRRTEIKSAVYEDRRALSHLLGALQRIEANPPPALAVSPDDAADAVRAAKLMASLGEALQTRTDNLAIELEKLARLQTDMEAEQVKLKANEEELRAKRTRTKSLVEQKSRLEASISQDRAAVQKRVAALAAEADTLRDLISRFERSTRDIVPRLKPDRQQAARENRQPSTDRRPTRPSRPLVLPDGTLRFAEAQGRIQAPVDGRITQAYTRARKGVTVAARAQAQVVAPHVGRVEFAGPFKNYDNVVILNLGEGYFMLLTGLGEIYANTDDIVTPGEPIGLMPFNTQSGVELYIEIRKDGAAINPNPWLGTAFAGNG